MTAKDPAIKVARHRLTILELAQQLGSVAEACWRSGMEYFNEDQIRLYCGI